MLHQMIALSCPAPSSSVNIARLITYFRFLSLARPQASGLVLKRNTHKNVQVRNLLMKLHGVYGYQTKRINVQKEELHIILKNSTTVPYLWK